MTDDRGRIIYGEPMTRPPSYSVHRYIQYLREFVSGTTPSRTQSAGGRGQGKADRKRDTTTPQDVLNPLSYFLRKLKLDLKTSYANFVSEFIAPPYNGLHLLLTLLKNIQGHSGKGMMAVPRGGGGGGSSGKSNSLHIEGYKQTMVDELDCLLCIKYTLRIERAVEEVTENNTGLHTIVACCLSHFYKSRISALEILSVLVTGPTAVDRILDAFTAIRVQYSESTRFKMLVNMLYTRGMDNLVFQISTLRLLNVLCDLCKSPNMRVFLQYEMEEAGLDVELLQQSIIAGHGLEHDDLDKQIHDWKTRYIDVNSLLKKIKNDMRREFHSQAQSDYTFDQHYGNPAVSRQSWGHPALTSADSSGTRVYTGRTGSWQAQREHSASFPSQEDVILYTGRDTYITSRVDHTVHEVLSRDVLAFHDRQQHQQQQHQQQQPYQYQQQKQQLQYHNGHQQQQQQIPHHHHHPRHPQRPPLHQHQIQEQLANLGGGRRVNHPNQPRPVLLQQPHRDHSIAGYGTSLSQSTPNLTKANSNSNDLSHVSTHNDATTTTTNNNNNTTNNTTNNNNNNQNNTTNNTNNNNNTTNNTNNNNNDNNAIYDTVATSSSSAIETPPTSINNNHHHHHRHNNAVHASNTPKHAGIDDHPASSLHHEDESCINFDDNWVFRKPSRGQQPLDYKNKTTTNHSTDISPTPSQPVRTSLSNHHQHHHSQSSPETDKKPTHQFETNNMFYTGSDSEGEDETTQDIEGQKQDVRSNDEEQNQQGRIKTSRKSNSQGIRTRTEKPMATERNENYEGKESDSPSSEPETNIESSRVLQEYKPKQKNLSKNDSDTPKTQNQMANAKKKVISGLLKAAREAKTTDSKGPENGMAPPIEAREVVANRMTASVTVAPPISSRCDDVMVKEIPPDCDEDAREALLVLDRTLAIHGGHDLVKSEVTGDQDPTKPEILVDRMKSDERHQKQQQHQTGVANRTPTAPNRTFMAYI